MAKDLDNSSDLQHEVCKEQNLGYSIDQELGSTIEERSKFDCFAFNTSKRTFYALTWDDITEATFEDEFFRTLRDMVATEMRRK